MKRILILETGAGFGGALTSLETLLSSLDPRRWEAHLLTSYPQEFIQAGGAVQRVGLLPRERRYGSGSNLERALRPVFGNRAGNAAFLLDHLTTGRRYAKAIAEYVREYEIDIVQGNNGILINDAVILAAKQAGKPCVIHVRGGEYPSRVAGWLARGVSRVLAVSGYVAETARALGVGSERIALVPEGLDAEKFASAAKPREFRARHGLPPNQPLVGMVGCLVAWKGHEVFLEACAKALPGTDAAALIVGGEPDGSGLMLAALREKARILGIEDRVFFTGYESDVASAMAACQVVVHASTSPEPFGRVILEAMALGRPIVATQAGGPQEVIEPGLDGLLVPPGDEAAMARAMGHILADAPMRERFAKAGWEKVRRMYSMENHVSRVESVWEELTG